MDVYSQKDTELLLGQIFESSNYLSAEQKIPQLILYIYRCFEKLNEISMNTKFNKITILEHLFMYFFSIFPMEKREILKESKNSELKLKIAQILTIKILDYCLLFVEKKLMTLPEIYNILNKNIVIENEEIQNEKCKDFIRNECAIYWTKMVLGKYKEFSRNDQFYEIKKIGYLETMCGNLKILQKAINFLQNDTNEIQKNILLLQILHYLPNLPVFF